MELRQACAVAASNTQRELTSVKPRTCPGGCGLCCGITRLVESGSVCGLVAADAERSRCLYDPCRWSWKQLRQLIVSPTQAGFHVVHAVIRDNGEVSAANGSFDIAVLGVVASKRPTLGAVVESLVRCIRPGGFVVALQPTFMACQSECAQTLRMATPDVARWGEFLRQHGCRSISILNDSHPLCPIKDPWNRPGTDCRGIGNSKPAHLSAVVAQVEASRRKDTL